MSKYLNVNSNLRSRANIVKPSMVKRQFGNVTGALMKEEPLMISEDQMKVERQKGGEFMSIFRCMICKDGAKMTIRNFKEHYRTMHKGKKLPRSAKYLDLQTCEVCGKYFKCWRNLRDHMEAHNNVYDCELCRINFKRVLSYVLHMRMHCEEDIFKCIYCHYSSTIASEISTHMKRKHESVEHKYRCEVCDKGFPLPTWFQEHDNFHTGEKPFECDLCRKSFSYTRHLTAHKTIVHKEKPPPLLYPHECVLCNKKYQQKKSLQQHMDIHNGHVVICEMCGKQFSSKEKLKFHLRTHTGYKPFKCGYCEKCFSRKPMLMEHERVHTGEKPYTCSHCNRPFSQRSSMIIHRRGHTGERPYACHICGKAFVARAMLNLHFKNCKGYVN